MKLGITILSKYDEHLTRLLDNLFEMQPDWQNVCEIVVGDDGLSEECKAKYQAVGVNILPMPKPFVFARNTNLCVAALDKNSDLLLLNDDIIFDTIDFVPKLEELLHSQPAEIKYHPYGAIALAISKGEIGNGSQLLYANKREDYSIRPLGTICFAAVCIARRAWDDTGPLDERFTGYGCDDMDWCRRAKLRGYRLGVTPLVTVQHGFGDIPASASFGKVDADAVYRSWELNRQLYIEKWGDHSI
jgi:GT2 family glycosyltransferase